MSRIDLVDLSARNATAQAQIEAGVLDVLRSGQFIGGPVVRQAEALAADWFGRQAAVGVASGTDALMLALRAVGVRPDDEVIVPALSFFATAGAVSAIGATPVMVDVTEDGLLNPEAAARAVSPRTRALVPVHLFGNRAPCPDLGVPVVDDSAQAIGASPPASLGLLSAVSVYPTKTWGAAGDGGFVVGDADAIDRVRRLGNHGISQRGFDRVNGFVGRNSRLDAIQAAVLVATAPRLPELLARRRALAQVYRDHLPRSVRPLAHKKSAPFQQFAVLTDARERAIALLDQADIGWAIYYRTPLNRTPAYAALDGPATPIADRLCDQLLALPIHARLRDADVMRVCDALRAL
jgi:dTDP-4-amino-4,6-dideoxygalactose transaminase